MKKKFLLIIPILLFSLILAAFDFRQVRMPDPYVLPDDAYGIWQIPDADVNIPLYTSDYYHAQEIIDNENSALYIEYLGGYGYMICDHGSQDYQMDRCDLGSIAFLIKDGIVKKYSCYGIFLTQQAGNTMVINNDTIRIPADDILSMNCYDDEGTRAVALFKYVGKFNE